METERYQPPTSQGWEAEIIEDANRIKHLPDSILKRGDTYEVQTKTGERISCENYQVDLKEAARLGIEGIKNPQVGNERLYLIAINSSGQIIGTRFTSLFVRENDILAKSIIKVLHKGKGYASPIEEAFQRQLQAIADQKGKSVVWQVSNQNLETLEDYKSGQNVDPAVLQEMEREQARWQALYGPENKLGIVDGKKIFTPKVQEEPEH